MTTPKRSFPSRLLALWRSIPVRNGNLAFSLLMLAIVMSALEAAYVQVVTTYQELGPSLLLEPSFLLLFSLDILVPTAVAMLSRRAFMVYLVGQCFLSTVLLHYTIFFYNPLTLSTIYHSMQGAASLGFGILGFARPEIIWRMVALMLVKLILVQMSYAEDTRMPNFWKMRGLAAVCCIALACCVYTGIYGRTGLSPLWVNFQGGHKTATERRLELGTREAVLNIGYIATWLGELASGKYKDTELIYAEARCADPELGQAGMHNTEQALEASSWLGLPVPKAHNSIVIIQVESLDFAALGLKVNGNEVLPFMNRLVDESVLLKVFAPHKVGSSNSDYEILNGRIADQNVIYYAYIRNYPDSVIHILSDKGYRPEIIHGLPGALFSLRNAYKDQGFSEAYFKEELERAGYQPSDLIMEHILDEDLFQFAAEKLDQDRPRAEFIITMSSHVPFMQARPEFKSSRRAFSRYTTSLNYFDANFAIYYDKLPEGTVLVLWGDHGSDVTYPSEYGKNSRHVPFVVHCKGNTEWMGGYTRNTDEIYRLCELSYYLRKIFKRADPVFIPE